MPRSTKQEEVVIDTADPDDLFRANLEFAGRFLPLVTELEDSGGIFKVNPL